MTQNFINAGWEKRENRTICRWFISFEIFDKDKIGGIICGYVGGGNFILERFYGVFKNEIFESLWIDIQDKISEKEIDFDVLDPSILTLIDNCEDEVWNFHSLDLWYEDDQLLLNNNKLSEVKSQDDMLYLESPHTQLVKEICIHAGLISHPL